MCAETEVNPVAVIRYALMVNHSSQATVKH